MTPALMYNDSMYIIGENLGKYMQSTLVQNAKLPLFPEPTGSPPSSATTHKPSISPHSLVVTKGISTGYVIGWISSLICIGWIWMLLC